MFPDCLVAKNVSTFQNHLQTKKQKVASKQSKAFKCNKALWKNKAQLIKNLIYLLSNYFLAYSWVGGKICPSKATLASELGCCIRTLDVCLKKLADRNDISIISGKKTWETNIYNISEAIYKYPRRRPKGFFIPIHLFHILQKRLRKAKNFHLKSFIYEHILVDFADHMLRISKYVLRNESKRRNKYFKKKCKSEKRVKLPHYIHLLDGFDLTLEQRSVLSHFSEPILRKAIEDLKAYEGWKKVIYSYFAFLISRCKKLKTQKPLAEDPAQKEKVKESFLEWLKRFLHVNRNSVILVTPEQIVPKATKEKRYFLLLENSAAKVWQKVQGHWTFRKFEFDQPHVKESIASYFGSNLICLNS